MAQYRLQHSTIYDYAEPVVIGTHFIHLLPRERVGQTIKAAQLYISPLPEYRRDEIDHFGNYSTSVSLTTPHKQFSVVLEAAVEVCLPPPPASSNTPDWTSIALWGQVNPDVAEFCLPSKLTKPTEEIAAYVDASLSPGRPILEALMELSTRIFTDMTYQTGITTNSTTASEVLEAKTGVCQDYTHLMLACLRARGLPGRYVSGYLRTLPLPGQQKWRGADQSHAWVSAWLGPLYGWVDFDPTNNLIVVDEHVTLAWGRDFTDVSPLRGVILGGGHHTLTVSVDLEPI